MPVYPLAKKRHIDHAESCFAISLLNTVTIRYFAAQVTPTILIAYNAGQMVATCWAAFTCDHVN